jgi:hypothetical protein
LISFFILSSKPLYAQELSFSQVAADHEAMAQSYEKKAAEQDTLIAEHTDMKADFKKKFYINEKVTPGVDKQMGKHCNAIIKKAQELKKELLEFAKWHQMRAAELQGR